MLSKGGLKGVHIILAYSLVFTILEICYGDQLREFEIQVQVAPSLSVWDYLFGKNANIGFLETRLRRKRETVPKQTKCGQRRSPCGRRDHCCNDDCVSNGDGCE